MQLKTDPQAIIRFEQKGYLFTTDKNEMYVDQIHRWLSERSYWAEKIPFETVLTAFVHSYCIGIVKDGLQIGYARFVTDYAVFAYLADVYVLEDHRGLGLSKTMIKTLMELPWVKQLRGIRLATRDAQSLYAQFGFVETQHPERLMEIVKPGIYKKWAEEQFTGE